MLFSITFLFYGFAGYMEDRLADWEDIVVDQRLDRGSAKDITSDRHRFLHCKKRLSIFPSQAGMSLTKFSLAGNNLIIPGQGELGK
jgi:hypothetical protein